MGINPVVSGRPALPPEPQLPLLCVGSVYSLSKALLGRDGIHCPLYWTCLCFHCFCYHIAFIFNHITDVIRGIIRCLRWLLGDLSAVELCIADGTNNVHCRSYQARGSRFLLAG